MPLADEEARLGPQIEGLVGGRVISLERQPRWRKAWYAAVDRAGETLPIYVRGDKQIDVVTAQTGAKSPPSAADIRGYLQNTVAIGTEASLQPRQ